MRVLSLIAMATLVVVGSAAQPALAGGFDYGGFAGGFSEGYARGVAIRARHAQALAASEDAKRERLCNNALESYLAGKGPMPPPMCNSAGTATQAAGPAPKVDR